MENESGMLGRLCFLHLLMILRLILIRFSINQDIRSLLVRLIFCQCLLVVQLRGKSELGVTTGRKKILRRVRNEWYATIHVANASES